jgi:ATP-dependent Clp protease ATP-binding subunit ClpB
MERAKIQGLKPYLLSRVIGQDDAVERVSAALKSGIYNLNDTGPRPRGSFIFMGGTGVGKTSLCKAFSEYLYGEDTMTMLFMNEMKSANGVSAFIDAMQRAVNAHPNGGVILCDEIEKAHKDIMDVFISALDEGQITLINGDRISLAKFFIVMTSNIGAERWGKMRNSKYSMMVKFATEQAKKQLRPELFARIDEVVVFRLLDHTAQIGILNLALEEKLSHLQPSVGKLSADERKVRAHLLRKCFTQAGGARALKKELDRQINAAVLPCLEAEEPLDGRALSYDTQRDKLRL